MTIIELHKRLSQIISENESKGYGERNAVPILIGIEPPPRQKYQRHRNAKRYPIDYVSSALHSGPDGFGRSKFWLQIVASENKLEI